MSWAVPPARARPIFWRRTSWLPILTLWFCRGSALGLDTASGVANTLRAAGIGFDVEGQKIPIVPAAILFDLLNGGKGWVDNPYAGLGAAAWQARDEKFGLGSAGAGFGTVAGPVKGGLGSASVLLENGVTIGALVAVNAHGAPSADGVPHMWAAPWELDDEFGGLGPAPAGASANVTLKGSLTPAQNTTIGIIATDARLDKAQCQRLAVAAHDGFARALDSPGDGCGWAWPCGGYRDGARHRARCVEGTGGTRRSGAHLPRPSRRLTLLASGLGR